MRTDARRRMSAAALGVWVVLMPLYPAQAQKKRTQPGKQAQQPPVQNEAARYITAAERLYEALEYERALEQLAQARRFPRSLAEDVRSGLFEGLILSDMGRRVEARTSFKTALLLDPQARLPVRTSPKVEKDFKEIRKEVRKELKLPETDPQDQALSSMDRPETPSVELVPETEPRPWLPSSVRMGSVSVPTPSLALLGAGVIAGGVGGYFGLRSRGQLQDARDASYQQPLAAHREEALGSARAANVLFGAAGLLATGAVVTWLLSGGEEASTTEATR